MKKLLVLILLTPVYFFGYSQVGGRHAYEFLNLVSSPRVAALGGKYVSSFDDDLSVVYHNPSVLNSDMDHHLSLNYVNYYAGVKYGYISYARKLNEKKNIAFGIQYINYGTFTKADPNGVITGTFTAAEYAFNIAVSQPIDSFLSIGADARPILSIYESYQSVGLSTDIGLTYHNPGKLYTLALVVRNFGTQIKTYSTYETLPFEIQAGFTQKLRYAPFRFSITAQHLETPDMSSPALVDDNQNLTPDVQPVTKHVIDKIADNVMRHLIFGVEFIPVSSFYIRAGYNYQRRQELKLDSHPSTVGLSWGFGLSISRFQISFARATYHVAGSTTHIAVATDLSSFYKREKKK
ncbi:MAG TPA: type IX secretion system protein PorQ [Bacteroidales bacterium]